MGLRSWLCRRGWRRTRRSSARPLRAWRLLGSQALTTHSLRHSKATREDKLWLSRTGLLEDTPWKQQLRLHRRSCLPLLRGLRSRLRPPLPSLRAGRLLWRRAQKRRSGHASHSATTPVLAGGCWTGWTSWRSSPWTRRRSGRCPAARARPQRTLPRSSVARCCARRSGAWRRSALGNSCCCVSACSSSRRCASRPAGGRLSPAGRSHAWTSRC